MDQFAGSIPEVYEQLLVPMIFQGAATRLAAIVAESTPQDVLETAAGTGVLTRELMLSCPDAHIIVTDLSQPMLDVAAARTSDSKNVERLQADALVLPFEAESFDVVACQFGVMFFPDRASGHREARRVLRPGGLLIFNVWDRIERNEVTAVIESALNEAVPARPLTFMRNGPHGYFSESQIEDDLAAADMATVSVSAVDATATSTPADAAAAFCQGTPMRTEIENHETLNVAGATAIAREALTRHFGNETFEAAIRYFEVVAQRLQWQTRGP